MHFFSLIMVRQVVTFDNLLIMVRFSTIPIFVILSHFRTVELTCLNFSDCIFNENITIDDGYSFRFDCLKYRYSILK